MRKHWMAFMLLAVLALASLGAAGLPGTVRGYVYLDGNRNGVMDEGEEGLVSVHVTVSYGEYQHTYWTGNGDPQGDVPGPGSYGPTPLASGNWMLTVHVPDGYRSTSPSELVAFVPEGGAATGDNFGLYGSGDISYASGTGVGMGGGAGAGLLPQTGNAIKVPLGHSIALLIALVGFVALLGTPWCVSQAKRVHERWW